ncbi:MAG TPA: hypothetical protein VD886_09745 [Herpetosiphonaceae bacterium]|nr:hypothetical protein [Herpetosiphonaceae bacterium]
MFKRIRGWLRQQQPANADPDGEPPATDPARRSGVLIDFGTNDFSGANIRIGNVAGGSLVQGSPFAEDGALAAHENEEFLRSTAGLLAERRTVLRQQIERFGDHAPVHMVFDLNATERRLVEVEARLALFSDAAE